MYAKYQMDDSHPDKFQTSFNRLPKEMQDEVSNARKAIFGKYDARSSKAAPSTSKMSPNMQAFADRLAGVQREQADKIATAKGAASEAPAVDERGCPARC